MLHASRSTRRLRATPLAAALACAFLTAGVGNVMASSAASPTASEATTRYALRLQSRRQRTAGLVRSAHPAAATGGVNLPVTSCLDDDDPGTLRNVLAGASEGDTVDLSALTCSTITLTQGAIDSSALGEHQLYDVTIQGPGRDALTIDAAGQSEVFVAGGFSSDKGSFTVNDLSIANGYYGYGVGACVEGFGDTVALNRVRVTDCHSVSSYRILFGGAVDVNTLEMTDSTITRSDVTGVGVHSNVAGAGAYAGGDATLIRSTISDNHATAPYAQYSGYASVGGGLYVRGNLTMVDSTISGNSIEATNDGQDAKGGGVYVRGIASISGSTIDGNSADGEGGGIFKAIYSVYGEPGGTNPQTKLTIVDSTISGNTAAAGAGIGISRPLYLSNSTIANNTASDGGGGILFRLAGIEDSGGTLQMQSTIVAKNTVGASATFAADLDADDALAVDGASNLVLAAGAAIPLPGDTVAEDPLLLPLALNGGSTRTQALAAGSPAIDAGNNAAALDFDQRGTGFARVSGAAADIGAFEIQQAPDDDVIFKDGFDGSAPGTFEYAYDDGDGDTNQGPPSTFDPDMLWGNYYLAQPGGEIITRLSVAFGPTFPSLANGPVTFWLLEDDDADFDPRNAHVIASVPATPDVFNDAFFSVDLSPTWVHGGFFVGASAKLQGGEDLPARVDTNAAGDKSWFFYAPDIAATIDDLAAAPFGARMDDATVVLLPGAFMVRANGEAAP